MHEAKLHRAKCLRLQGSENSCPTARSKPSSFFDAREAWKPAFLLIFRRPESSKASERAFSDILDVRRLRSTSGGFGASIFEHFRRLEASERPFSSIFDIWRLRSEDSRGFSRRAGCRLGGPSCQVPNPPGRTAIFLYRYQLFLLLRLDSESEVAGLGPWAHHV